eukprot:TRINITY_DN49982_c1_g1_i1.p1 TRINITY_DN49982_c1_g1~~TRINITY_DN49982_c1_g1_i1.p1  ORF type:complete len:240 (+),score=37.61 TRINITY_DN49982_c1_g1_i1:35-754(+)
MSLPHVVVVVPDVVSVICDYLPVQSVMNLRRADRFWHEHACTSVNHFLGLFNESNNQKGAITGWKCAEMASCRPGTLLHVRWRERQGRHASSGWRRMQEGGQDIPVSTFVEREGRRSFSKILRMIGFIIDNSSTQQQQQQPTMFESITLHTGWGWTLAFNLAAAAAASPLSPSLPESAASHSTAATANFFHHDQQQPFVLEISEAHLDYDSYMCEDWYEKNPYARVTLGFTAPATQKKQ